MSVTKLKTIGNWATPPKNTNAEDRPLTGRVIFGMLTGEGPDHTVPTEVITSAKDRRR